MYSQRSVNMPRSKSRSISLSFSLSNLPSSFKNSFAPEALSVGRVHAPLQDLPSCANRQLRFLVCFDSVRLFSGMIFLHLYGYFSSIPTIMLFKSLQNVSTSLPTFFNLLS